jgi:hypothetical protein
LYLNLCTEQNGELMQRSLHYSSQGDENLYASIQKQIKQALKVSPSPIKYTVFKNIAELAQVKLTGLYYEDEKQELMPLIHYYAEEACAKDKLRLLKAFNLRPNEDAAKIRTFFSRLEILYKNNCSKVEYEAAFLELKEIIFLEKLLSHLPIGAKLSPYRQLFIENINIPEKLFAVARLIPDLQLSDFILQQLCNGFEVLRSINNAEKMRKNIEDRILYTMNEDFKKEVIVQYDLQETTLTGREQLFRGLRDIEPGKAGAVVEDIFNNTHYMKEDPNQALFHFHIKQAWIPNIAKGQQWGVGGVYTSFNKYVSVQYAITDDSDQSGAGIILDIRPHKNKHGFYGRYTNQQEIIFNHISPEEIRCIYEIKNRKIKKIYHNPNYKQDMQGERDLAFQVGDDLKEFVTKEFNSSHSVSFRAEYGKAKFIKDDARYTDENDFNEKYALKPEAIGMRREGIIKRKNFPNSQVKLKACLLANASSLAMGYLYQQLEKSINPVIHEQKLIWLKNKTPLFVGANSQGNNVFQMAVTYGHERVIKYLKEKMEIQVNHQNFRGETAAHTAVEHDNAAVIKFILSSAYLSYDRTLQDVAGNDFLNIQSGHIELLERYRISLRFLYNKNFIAAIDKGIIQPDELAELAGISYEKIIILTSRPAKDYVFDFRKVKEIPLEKLEALISSDAIKAYQNTLINPVDLQDFEIPKIAELVAYLGNNYGQVAPVLFRDFTKDQLMSVQALDLELLHYSPEFQELVKSNNLNLKDLLNLGLLISQVDDEEDVLKKVDLLTKVRSLGAEIKDLMKITSEQFKVITFLQASEFFIKLCKHIISALSKGVSHEWLDKMSHLPKEKRSVLTSDDALRCYDKLGINFIIDFNKIDAMGIDDLKQFLMELTKVSIVLPEKSTHDPWVANKYAGTAGFLFWDRKPAEAIQFKKQVECKQVHQNNNADHVFNSKHKTNNP